MDDDKILEVNHLKKYFKVGKGVLKAVDDVSFFIRKGETLGLVGESGCGKTTCSRTCIGIYDRTEGEVLYKGENVHQLKGRKKKEFTKEVQIIFQDPYSSLDPKMKVGDIIAEGLRAHKMCASREEERRVVRELLETVELNSEHATRYVHEFSGGQRQRIGIARALAVEPEFIVCDEPISALDVSIQAQIVNLLIRLQKEKNLTYMFIAHDLSMVKHISDRVCVMYLGTIGRNHGFRLPLQQSAAPLYAGAAFLHSYPGSQGGRREESHQAGGGVAQSHQSPCGLPLPESLPVCQRPLSAGVS